MELPKLTRKARERERETRAAVEAPRTRLEERREQLRERFTQLQWDLGGAAYEMASRDYFRLDVLAKMAARLQTVDAELAEIERMAKLESAGAAGSCPGCGSLYAQGAVYCWRCGRNIHATGNDVVSRVASTPLSPQSANGHAGGYQDQGYAPESTVPGAANQELTGEPAGDADPYPHETVIHPDTPLPGDVPDPGFDPGGPVRDAFVEMDLDSPRPREGEDPSTGWEGGEIPPGAPR
ncbi:MAG: hypothetical protein ACKORM_00855 [Solirubrobacterales bacterium]